MKNANGLNRFDCVQDSVTIINLFNQLYNIDKNTSITEVESLVDKIYYSVYLSDNLSNYEKAVFMVDLIVFIFYVRDFRNNGKGLRDHSRTIFMKLKKYFPRTLNELLLEFPNYGSWKDYNLFIENTKDKVLHKRIYSIYIDQLKKDKETYNSKNKSNSTINISLAAKWVPKEGKSLDRRFKCSKELSKRLFPELYHKNTTRSLREFRKFYLPLQKILNTTENMECNGNYDLINFNNVSNNCLDKKLYSYLYIYKTGGIRGCNKKRIKCRENVLKFLETKKNNKNNQIMNEKYNIKTSTSFDTLKVELNHSCYNKIREIIENISEGLFKHYTVDTYSDLPDLIDDSSSYLEDSDTTYSHFSITSSESESESENDENADIIIKLRKLRILLDEELITNEDYDIVKKRLLEYM